MPTIRIALIVCAIVNIASHGGCDNQDGGSTTASQPPPPKLAIDQSDIKLPEYYGLYAIEAGKTIEIKEGGEPAAFSPSVEFLLFHKMAARASGNLKLHRVNLKPEPPKPADDGSFKGWDDWYQKSQVDFPKQMEAAQTDVPGGSSQIQLRKKPVTNQSEMLRLVPAAALEPGLYQLDAMVRFWVNREHFLKPFRHAAHDAHENSRWNEAILNAKFVLSITPNDADMGRIGKSASESLFERDGGELRVVNLHANRGGMMNGGSADALRQIVALSTDGAQILSGGTGYRSGMALWDAKSGTEIRRFNDGEWTTCVAFRSGRNEVLSGDQRSVKLWDAQTGTQIREYSTKGHVKYIAVTGDGDRLLCAVSGQPLQLWEIESGELVRSFGGGPDEVVECVAISPDGLLALAGYGNRRKESPGVRMWDLTLGEEVHALEGHDGPALKVSFSRDGKVAFATRQNGILAWDVETGKQVPSLHSTSELRSVSDIALSLDGRHILLADESGTVVIMQESFVPFNSFRSVPGIRSLAISDDGRYLVLGRTESLTLRQLPKATWVDAEAQSAIESLLISV